MNDIYDTFMQFHHISARLRCFIVMNLFSSFDPAEVFCFLTVSNPAFMGILMIFKVSFQLVCWLFGA